MTVYVDPLMDHGWILRGHQVRSCHLFTDSLDLAGLHEIARRVGCRLAWFQGDKRMPHYDLTIMRRQEAIGCGAVPVERRRAVEIWHARQAAVARIEAADPGLCPRCPAKGYCERLHHCARVAAG